MHIQQITGAQAIYTLVFDTMLGFNDDKYIDNMYLESDDEF